MGAGSCLSKCVIITINILFWLGSALMIFAGVAFLSSADGVMSDVDCTAAYVTISIGALLFFCGLIGICGACFEKKILLGTFAVITLVVLAMLAYVTASIFIQHDQVDTEVDNFMVDEFNNYGNPNATVKFSFAAGNDNGKVSTTTASPTTTTVATTTSAATTTAPTTPSPNVNATSFIDSIQNSLECCGWKNYTDWNTYTYWVKNMHGAGYVPKSCCNETAANTIMNTTCSTGTRFKMDKTLIYSKACEKPVHDLVNFAYGFVSWTSVAFVVLVALGFIGSIYLIRSRRSSDGFSYSSIVA